MITELAIKNTSIWLGESPIQHKRVSHNAFCVTDRTVGVPRYDVDLVIDQGQVSYASKVVPPVTGPVSGRLALDEAAMRFSYQTPGPALGMSEDGSIVAHTDYEVGEHTPKKLFGTLASFEYVHREIGPRLYEIAANRNLKFKKP